MLRGSIDPLNCFQIDGFQQEIETNKDRKPIDIYLDHCNFFAKNNLQKESIEVEHYIFGQNSSASSRNLASSDITSLDPAFSKTQNGGPILHHQIIADVQRGMEAGVPRDELLKRFETVK